MFSFRKYHEVTACIRGQELLTQILETTGIRRLWLSAEHVFLSTKDSSDLYAFDVVPQLKWRRSVPTKPNDCILDTNQEQTIDIVWRKSEPSLVYVVSETGTTGFWEFLKPSHEWIKHKSFHLSNAKGARIVDVKLHEESGNIIWCERRGSGTETYCVCCRNISGDEREKSKAELGTTQAILHNCPPISIFSFSNGMCIHPCQVYLEKIHIFWTGRKELRSVVLKDEQVEESAVCSSDFPDIASSLIGCWSANSDELCPSSLGMTVHPSSQDLLILNCNGALSKVCVRMNHVKLVPICNIDLPGQVVENQEEVKLFIYNEMVFGLVDHCGVVFLFDVLSGKLLYKLEDFSGSSERLNVLTSCSTVSTTVFWKTNCLWKLECPSLNELVKSVTTWQSVDEDGPFVEEEAMGNIRKKISMNDQLLNTSPQIEDLKQRRPCESTALDSKTSGVINIAVWLSVYGLEHSAAVLILDHIISCLASRMEIPKTALHILRQMASKVFQNPTVLLALCDKQLSLEDDNLNELKQFLEELDQSTVPSTFITPLNMHLQPLLHELFNVMSQQREVPFTELRKLSKVLGEAGAADVDAALQSVVSGTSSGVCLDKMEILSLHEPEYAVEGFLQVNRENIEVDSKVTCGKIHDILRDELKDRKWKRRRNHEHAIVLSSLFKLLYADHPEMLVDILEIAKKCISEGASKDEATLQDLEECIRDFTLEFLPSVWSQKKCDLKRIKIHSNLLVRLAMERDALDLLLQRKQWQEAVDLYVELSHCSSDQQFSSQLYEMLLVGILRGSGTSERLLLVKVFELKPDIIDIHNLFQLCLRNTPLGYLEAVLGEGLLTVEEARKALGQFLQKS